MQLVMPLLSLSRRFRRPLLLPPGWVALGFLLLLGCLLLQTHWRQLRRHNALQITMPPLRADTALATFYRVHRIKRDTAEYNPFTDVSDKNALAKINRMRPWHTIDFGGQPLIDFFSAPIIESSVRAINADSSHAGGVRIRFRAGTTYANLVKVLDIMNYTGQKKYWLDNRYRPTTFYIITDRPLPVSSQPADIVCGYHYQSAKVSPPSFCQRLLAKYWPPAWRLSWLLLLVLGALSLNRLRRADLAVDYAT
jgi:hypothetical protein